MFQEERDLGGGSDERSEPRSNTDFKKVYI